MNKEMLIDIVKDKNPDLNSKAQAGRVIASALDAIKDAVTNGDSVQLVGFGSFTVSERSARTVKSPKTGTPVKVAAHKAIKFKPGKAFKDMVNE